MKPTQNHPSPSGTVSRLSAPVTPARSREADNVLPFRRRGKRVRRSRRSPLIKWAKPCLAATVTVVLPAAVVAWPLTSPHFALQELAVETGERVSDEWVRRQLRPLMGENLPLLSLERAQSLLVGHPWTSGVDLRKQLPARLAVRVNEKRAVALLRDEGELLYLDAGGSRIAPFDPLAGDADLLLLSIDQPHCSPAAGIALVREIEVVGPAWSAGLSEIEILGENDFRVHTTSLPFPLLIRAGTFEQKTRLLEELLPQLAGRYGNLAAVDLRFNRRIIVKPLSSAGGARRPARRAPQRPAQPGTDNREAAANAQRG